MLSTFSTYPFGPLVLPNDGGDIYKRDLTTFPAVATAIKTKTGDIAQDMYFCGTGWTLFKTDLPAYSSYYQGYNWASTTAEIGQSNSAYSCNTTVVPGIYPISPRTRHGAVPDRWCPTEPSDTDDHLRALGRHQPRHGLEYGTLLFRTELGEVPLGSLQHHSAITGSRPGEPVPAAQPDLYAGFPRLAALRLPDVDKHLAGTRKFQPEPIWMGLSVTTPTGIETICTREINFGGMRCLKTRDSPRYCRGSAAP